MPQPTPAIIRSGEMQAADRGNGARTIRLVTRDCGSSSLMNGITSFDPGARIGLHFHNCEESVLVLEGEAVAEIGGERHRLGAGDATWIPAGVPHRFLNESGRPMRIFWTYATVDATRTMVETGVEQPIDAEHGGPKRA